MISTIGNIAHFFVYLKNIIKCNNDNKVSYETIMCASKHLYIKELSIAFIKKGKS